MTQAGDTNNKQQANASQIFEIAHEKFEVGQSTAYGALNMRARHMISVAPKNLTGGYQEIVGAYSNGKITDENFLSWVDKLNKLDAQYCEIIK